MKPSKEQALLVLILLFAVGLRWAAMSVWTQPDVGDEFDHLEVAESLFTDHPFTNPSCYTNLTKVQAIPCPMHYRPPLYNILLAVGLFFEHSFKMAQLVNILIGVLAIIPAYFIAKLWYRDNTPRWTAFFIAINPWFIFSSVQIMPRMAITLFILVMFYFALKKNTLLFGVFAGLSYLIHYSALVYILFCFLIIDKRKWAFLIMLMVISPWLIRNYAVFGNPLYTTSTYGMLLTDWKEYHTLTEPPTLMGYVDKMGWTALLVRPANVIMNYIPPFGMGQYEYGLNFVVFYSMLGIVTPIILILGAYYTLSSILTLEHNKAMSLIVFISLLAPLTWGFLKSNGSATEACVPLAPLFTMIVLHKNKYKRWIFLGILLQMAVMLSYLT